MNIQILFVNSNEKMIEQMKIVEKNHIASVEVAKDGKECLEMLKEKKFPIVITDIHLEEKDGLKLLSEINKSYPSIVCMVYCGFIGPTEIGFLLNKLSVFRIFVWPADIRTEIIPAIEDAFVYYQYAGFTGEMEKSARMEKEHNKKKIETLSYIMEHQKENYMNIVKFSNVFLKKGVKSQIKDEKMQKTVLKFEKNILLYGMKCNLKAMTKLSDLEAVLKKDLDKSGICVEMQLDMQRNYDITQKNKENIRFLLWMFLYTYGLIPKKITAYIGITTQKAEEIVLDLSLKGSENAKKNEAEQYFQKIAQNMAGGICRYVERTGDGVNDSYRMKLQNEDIHLQKGSIHI